MWSPQDKTKSPHKIRLFLDSLVSSQLAKKPIKLFENTCEKIVKISTHMEIWDLEALEVVETGAKFQTSQ